MSLVLTGYRGSGKTTIGRLLAAELGRPFVDCDDLIAQRAGKTIREIFAEKGEAGFRILEKQAVAQVAKLHDHVIGLGGGALGLPENRAAIQKGGHFVVYLRCEPATLGARISGDAATADNRPHLTKLGGGIEEIVSVLTQREPIYRAIMHRELDVTHLTPGQAVENILGWKESW